MRGGGRWGHLPAVAGGGRAQAAPEESQQGRMRRGPAPVSGDGAAHVPRRDQTAGEHLSSFSFMALVKTPTIGSAE